MKSRRFVIVFDGVRYHVRKLRQTLHDALTDEMVYRCDEPIANDLVTLQDAAEEAWHWSVAEKLEAKRKTSRARNG